MNTEPTIQQIPIELIIPNRFQPRLLFDEQGLNELSASIKEHGIIQPLVLRPVGDKYEIIAGERRYKAATLAGLATVPSIVNHLDDNESAEVALIENVQRRDLSSIEEARSYRKILEKNGITQDLLAKRLGLSQAAVANKLRLLNLDQEVQDALMNEKISERHARSLLQFSNLADQKQMLSRIINERLTVRQLDVEIKKIIDPNGLASEPGIEELPNDSNLPGSSVTAPSNNIFDNPAVTTNSESTSGNIFDNPGMTPGNVFDNATSATNQEFVPNNPFDNPTEQAGELNSQTLNNTEPLEEFKLESLDLEEEATEEDSSPESKVLNSSTDKIFGVFDPNPHSSLEDEAVNMNFEIGASDFNPFTTEIESESKAETPEELPAPEPAPKPEPEVKEVKKRIQPDNLASVNLAYKELAKEVKEEGYLITTEEFDFEDLYQIIIKIEKQAKE